MINISKLQEDISVVLDSLSSAKSLIQEQENYVTTPDIVTYKLTIGEQIGSKASEHVGGNSTLWTEYTLWRLTLNLRTVGVDSQNILLEIAHKLNKDSVKDKWRAIGLTYLCKDTIKPFPRILTTGTVQCYSLDVDFTTLITDTDDLGYVEFLEITVDVENELGDVILEEDITVDIIP